MEVTALIEKIQKDSKLGITDHNLISHIDIAVGSIINSILFGYRFDGVRLCAYFYAFLGQNPRVLRAQIYSYKLYQESGQSICPFCREELQHR